MARVASMILAGGEGTRLQPLTFSRAKPMVNLGSFCLLDFPLSHSLTSNAVQDIFVLTQFLSGSIDAHLENEYFQGVYRNKKVRALAPPKDLSYSYLGTADSIRKNMVLLESLEADYIAVLSGDQLYAMNIDELIHFGVEKRADFVVACKKMDRSQAFRYGIMQIESDAKISRFVEKPQDPLEVESLCSEKGKVLVSMGIYLFSKSFLVDLLTNHPGVDFGKDLIPAAIRTHRGYAYTHLGYWEDIGTIRSYYDTNLLLADGGISQEIFAVPLLRSPRSLPPAKIENSYIVSSVICEGSSIHSAYLSKSVIGPGSKLHPGAHLEGAILLGNHVIDQGVYLKQVIVDEGAKIAAGVRLIGGSHLHDGPLAPGLFAKEGILVVERNAIITSSF